VGRHIKNVLAMAAFQLGPGGGQNRKWKHEYVSTLRVISTSPPVRHLQLRSREGSELDASDKGKDQHNHEQKAQNTGGAIAPATAVGPSWGGGDQEKNNDDEQKIARAHWPTLDVQLVSVGQRRYSRFGSKRMVARIAEGRSARKTSSGGECNGKTDAE
jgi:hypothetical protein